MFETWLLQAFNYKGCDAAFCRKAHKLTMRPTFFLSVLSLPLSMVLATPLAGGGEVTARQISLNPASSCPRNQLWCCDTVGILTNPLIAAALVALKVVDPTGFNEMGIDCSSLTWPFGMNCPSPGKQVCCDPDLPFGVGEVLKVNCRAVNPLLR